MGRAERRAAEKTAKTELKKLQALPVDKFAGWLGKYQHAAYEDGFGDGVESNTMAMMRYLHDEFGFGNTRFQRLIEHARQDVQAMREGYITPKDVKDGLAAEGVTCLKQMQMKGEPDPLRAEAEKPEGNAGISITAGAGKYKKKVTPAPDPKDEEPAEVFQLDESNVDMMFPEEPEREAEEDEEQAEYTVSEVKTFEKMALNDYQQKLRELAWRIFLSGVPGTHTMKDIYADIGYALVKELAKGGETDEALQTNSA